ncbi:hypothetical protein [Saccharospirillum impatiens]|uniref:hypothetical protein n=1 Tax=Saccharospirillum impatiens TaxID=169438 RepID=UPI0003F73E22|nr:hypothetical protein [Saccharospirillum impatiens]
MTRFFCVFTLIGAFVLSGCSNLSTQSQARINWPDSLAEPASLIDTLDADVITYARVPSPSAWITAPKNNAMGDLLATDANRAAVTTLLDALRQQLAPLGAEGATAGLLLDRLRSPLELAVRLPQGTAVTGAELQLTARLDFDSRAAFEQQLGTLLQGQSGVRQLAPATQSEPGRLSFGVVPGYYQFDPQTRRFTLSAGFASSAQSLAQLGAVANPEHPALKRQAALEDSRYGLYLWANTAAVLPQVETFLPASQVSELDTLGLMNTQELALAMGSRNGQGQTTVLVRGTNGPLWDLSLPDNPATQVKSLGEPDHYFTTVIPDEDWVRRLASASDWSVRDLNQLTAKTGVSWTSLAAGLAGRFSVIADDAGSYLALEPSDAEAFASVLDDLRYLGYTETTAFSTPAGTMSRLQLPFSKLWLDPGMPAMSDWFHRSQDSRGWYIEQDGIWYFATVPQVLLARQQAAPGVSLADWSQQHSDQPTTQFIGQFDSLIQTNYHYYLEGLQTLAHMLNTEIDMLAFPVAPVAQLPEQSRASLSITYRGDTLQATYGYETHPFDPLQGSMGGVAVIGILAAIAIPAYQDYAEQAALYSDI